MTRSMLHMTLNVTVLATLTAALWAVRPAPYVVQEVGECDAPIEVVDYTEGCRKVAPVGLNDMILVAAGEYGVDPAILATTVYRESECDASALGGSGEIGLGQVHPKVWLTGLQTAGIVRHAKDLYDPLTNLRASAYVLKTLTGRADCARDLFRLYNGSGKMARKYADEQMVAYRELWGKTPEI